MSKQKTLNIGTGIAIGIAIGTALGVALGNIAVGIGAGLAIGAAIGLTLNPAGWDASPPTRRNLIFILLALGVLAALVAIGYTLLR